MDISRSGLNQTLIPIMYKGQFSNEIVQNI